MSSDAAAEQASSFPPARAVACAVARTRWHTVAHTRTPPWQGRRLASRFEAIAQAAVADPDHLVTGGDNRAVARVLKKGGFRPISRGVVDEVP